MNKEKIKIKVKTDTDELYIKDYEGQNLLEILQKNHVYVSNVCHGNGTCGKCKIKVFAGKLPITETDKRLLSKEELKQGIRLACKANIEERYEVNNSEELYIEIVGKSENEIVVEGISEKKGEAGIHKIDDLEEITTGIKIEQTDMAEANYVIAIDIGTTTIAMALVDAETGEIRDAYTSLNHQRKFGADVISRIVAANEGKMEELKRLIEEDLWKGIRKLTKIENQTDISVNDKSEEANKQKKINLTQVIIAGNTTMIHLLMGYSCQSLGKYPFISGHLEQIDCTLKECISFSADDKNSLYEKVSVTILPGISAFIGGDIVADILNCPKFEKEEISLLIDLGTNGEMVIGNKDRLVAASTAAGPAFEGGNITCGTASIPGSICQVKIQNQRAVVKTIKDKIPPIGVCGTGLMSVIAQLKQNKIMDEQGVLRYPYNEKGFPLWTLETGDKISVYQRDIREFQMAKAAIRAGIEILMEEYGCRTEEVSHVYLAGGFGANLLEEDVIDIGILPEEFRGRSEPIGNGALQGAIQAGRGNVEAIGKLQDAGQGDKKRSSNKKMNDSVMNIVKRTQYISLAENEKFQKKYLEYMMFDK